MQIEIVETATVQSGDANEDRVGHALDWAWVIDGATDVLGEKLTADITDAHWFAAHADAFLRQNANGGGIEIARIPAAIANETDAALASEAHRQPTGRAEHPSATAAIVNLTGAGLSYLGVGDCTLMIETQDSLQMFGPTPENAADRLSRSKIMEFRQQNPDASAATLRAHLIPSLGAARAAMNMPGGYGVLSLTKPPSEFVETGTLSVSPGDRLLLATDGMMRLVDVFAKYSGEEIFAAAWAKGLDAILSELRELESGDKECKQFPRVKSHDDATGLLARIV